MAVSSSARYPAADGLCRGQRRFLFSITEAIGAGWMLWALAGLGLVVGLLDRKSRASTGFLFGLLAFSALAVCQDSIFGLITLL
jgi:hypothetical protein